MNDNREEGPGASIVGKRKHTYTTTIISARADEISNFYTGIKGIVGYIYSICIYYFR